MVMVLPISVGPEAIFLKVILMPWYFIVRGNMLDMLWCEGG